MHRDLNYLEKPSNPYSDLKLNKMSSAQMADKKEQKHILQTVLKECNISTKNLRNSMKEFYQREETFLKNLPRELINHI